jgi:glycosyltransferase involved in cell wall biosynthesis
MNIKKISLIIPTYNGEKYIERCVDSILHQKRFDINTLEVLLLDDESKDGTFEISKRYAQEFPHIVRSFRHKNIGVARTRNKGIGLATGEYLAFIDQDDYIDDDFCAVLYAAASEGD